MGLPRPFVLAAPLAMLAFVLSTASSPDGPRVAAAASGRGAYTSAQAASGAKAYAANCASCHGAKLQGVTAPPLKGAAAPFHATQNAGDVYTYISTQMPMGKPGSLAPTTYAAILAYLMQQNGHPAGARALTPATAARSTEKM